MSDIPQELQDACDFLRKQGAPQPMSLMINGEYFDLQNLTDEQVITLNKIMDDNAIRRKP